MTERDNNQLAVGYTTETGVEYLTQNQGRSGVAGSPGDEHALVGAGAASAESGINFTPGNDGLLNSGTRNSGVLNGGVGNTGIANNLLGPGFWEQQCGERSFRRFLEQPALPIRAI